MSTEPKEISQKESTNKKFKNSLLKFFSYCCCCCLSDRSSLTQSTGSMAMHSMDNKSSIPSKMLTPPISQTIDPIASSLTNIVEIAAVTSYSWEDQTMVKDMKTYRLNSTEDGEEGVFELDGEIDPIRAAVSSGFNN